MDFVAFLHAARHSRPIATRATAAWDNAFYTPHTSFQIQFATSRCGTYGSSHGTTVGNLLRRCYCFNIAQLKWVAILLPYNSQIKAESNAQNWKCTKVRVWWMRGINTIMCMRELCCKTIEKTHKKIKVCTDLMFMKLWRHRYDFLQPKV